MAPRPRFLLASAAGFAAAAVFLFAPSLHARFVSDDWEFLILADTARSIAVCFDLLVGRFVRPLVMLTYYAGYRAFGLWPAPYHLFAVALHALNAWLLCLVVTTLDPRRRRWPGLAAGGLFLAFAGHTEAVSWVAGLADLFVLGALLAMLLAIDRALEPRRPGSRMAGPAGWMPLAWTCAAVGLLGKESAVVLPAVGIVYAAARRAPLRRIVRFASVPAIVVAVYWGLRIHAYGNPAAAYGGLGAYSGSAFQQARALLIRAFAPPSSRIALAWDRGRDIPFVAVALAGFALAWWRAADRRTIGFAVCALLITLAPVAPLSFSLETTESERMFYVPTAFGAVLMVMAVDALARAPVLRIAVLAGLIGAHAVLLQRLQRRWVEAGNAFNDVATSFVAAVRAHDPGPSGLMFVLSMPDDLRGAYVFRRGFLAALHFSAPDLAVLGGSIVRVESQSLERPTDPVAAGRVGPLTVSLDIAPNRFRSTAPPLRPFYTFPEWSPTRYVLQFTPAIGRGVVFFVSASRTQFLADVDGPGAPFGNLDIPADGATCDGRLRFSGWALDDREVVRVVALRDRTPADPPGADPIVLGEAARAYDTRPDVAEAYAGFPHTDRAGWNFELACPALAALPNRAAHVTIRAIDDQGHAAVVGARTVRLAPVR